jgi:transcription-repair coupling factor (superfamily II helicase)
MSPDSSASSDLLELALPHPGSPAVRWGQLYGAALALAAAEAATRHRGPVLIVTGSAADADRLEREIAFFCGEHRLQRFPDYETLPYEPFSPPQDLLAERLSSLHRLASGEATALITDASALLNRLPPPEFITARSIEIHVGQRLDRDDMIARFINHGYLRVEQVAGAGEISVRGALLDIFPTGAPAPVRIDFFDDEIESLRLFDPLTQLTTRATQSVRILPAREFPFDEAGIRDFRASFRDRFPVEPGRCPIYRDISDAQLPAGIEYYLPLFFERTVTLLDYLPPDALLITLAGTAAGLDAAWELASERYEQLGVDPERPILAPEDAFWNPATLTSRFAAHLHLSLQTPEAADEDRAPALNAGSAHPISAPPTTEADRIDRWLSASAGERTLLVASSPGHREMLAELLRGRGYDVRVLPGWAEFRDGDERLAVAVGELEEGLLLPKQRLRVLTAAQLGLERARAKARRRRAARDPESIIRELTDLREGAPVVHEDHGVGRYRGLKTLDVDGLPTEFLVLEYADADKLYVPVQSLHLVSRYTGAPPEQAPLHKLGSDQWAKARRKAAQQARDTAAQLLNVYARRAARIGNKMPIDADSYRRFALEFPFEETEDQLEAIRQVLEDLAGEQPMDRVVCGDVGFGKTEVALRSAFIAVHAGFQVAVLVPTTLLAQQHFRTFSDRFADWPVRVELMSRFRNARETKTVVDGLSDGRVDIVIGTHKMLQKDVRFRNLGLVIVDEEHRFGVKHKERLKTLRAEVDVLTMTATPIPRTLNMTLGGLRELSIIATPPAERMAVKTFVGEWRDRQIRDAVAREIRRGGQVYFVHNRVENIESIAGQLEKLLPEAQIRVAHGQLPERELETVMLDFYHRRFNVLVCSTIIESGIDIPTANTIIINRADRFGLAQLHQLRGRVGRSHHQAYAYLIAPPTAALTADAAKRLEAIEALEELGSGFTVATHDLEIRGAGELLGEEQSGQIQAVGFTLYNELLGRAVAALRAGHEPDLEDPFEHGPEIELGLPALIPEDYLPDVHMRLVHYKRIANAASAEELDALQVELIDRFGLLPPATKNLFAVTGLKLLAQRVGILKIQAGASGGTLRFGERAAIDPVALVRLIEREPGRYRLDGPYKLRFSWTFPDEAARIEALRALLLRLGAGRVATADDAAA